MGAATTPALSAEVLAGMIRDADVPCVTLADEADVTAEPASTAGEGLRIVRGSLPVRVFYAIPPDNYAALRRRDSHLLWLYDWIERQRWPRWSAQWPEPGWVTVHDEPWLATCMLGGHEVFRATGRRVDEDPGGWVVLWIVEDAEAWAASIEAEVWREISRASRECLFPTASQQQLLDGAARIREQGPSRTIRSVELDQQRAVAHVASLAAAGPDPGVRHEAAPVTATAACITCYCPTIEADGWWWHDTGGYPAECPGRRCGRSLPLEPGDWEIDSISMTCGYCGLYVTWPETLRSWARLTGVRALGIHRDTGELVVLAEAAGVAAQPGQLGYLAHHCAEIPAWIRAQVRGRRAASRRP